MEDIEKLKYPIGQLIIPEDIPQSLRQACIKSIGALPDALDHVTKNLTEEQYNTAYRPDGWSIRQLVHHIADSHINAFTRFKLGLTEDEPTIRPYDQDSWCNMSDAQSSDPQLSLNIIRGIHGRWVKVLKTMRDDEYERNIYHPEMKKKLSLGQLLSMYGWHSDHHLAHIKNARERHNW
jgi:hypothetical protein